MENQGLKKTGQSRFDELVEKENATSAAYKEAQDELLLIKEAVLSSENVVTTLQGIVSSDDVEASDIERLTTKTSELRLLKSVEKKAEKLVNRLNAKAERINNAIVKHEIKIAQKAKRAEERKANRPPTANGVTRPKPSTRCGRIWAACETLTEEAGDTVALCVVVKAMQAEGYNLATIKTQYSRWRKFIGVTGRINPPVNPELAAKKAEAEAQLAAEKAAEKAEKAAEKERKRIINKAKQAAKRAEMVKAGKPLNTAS